MSEHDELRGLLGAYALNAVPAIEHRRVERHLAECRDCRREVRLLGATTAELAWLGGLEESDDLVDRITSSLPARPRRARMRLAAAVAAAAMAAAGVFGSAYVRERSRADRLAAVLATSDRRVALASHGGFAGAGTVYVAESDGALVLDGVPPPTSGRAYQLWGIDDGQATSMGVIEGTGRAVHLFGISGEPNSFAITIEPSGGSRDPTTDPVMSGM